MIAKRIAESPAFGKQWMEEICQRDNCRQALARVKANRGSPGMDGMNVQQLPDFLKEHWLAIRKQLLSGTYKPQPVKRVEIPKPGGGVRKLGIPTLLDRFIQQAVMQVMQRSWDWTFSDYSYGFRPGRSAHQAVAQAQQYWTSVCALCRRLQYLRRQSPGWGTGHGQYYGLAHHKTSSPGQSTEKRGGSAMGAEVSRIQLYAGRRTQTAKSAAIGGPLQGASAETDAPDARYQHREDGGRVSPVSPGLARLLRPMRDTECAS